MSNGCFAYYQESLTYSSSTYQTKRDWALAVHIARCKAFYYATFLSKTLNPDNIFSGIWDTDSTVSDIDIYIPRNPDITDPDDPDYSVYVLWIQDLHASDVDPNGQYPAFYTVFTNIGSNVQYAIVTSLGFTNNALQKNDPSKGLYVAVSVLSGNGSKSFIPIDLAHMLGCNGITLDNDSISDKTALQNGELSLCSSFGLFSSASGFSSTATSDGGIIQNPTNGITYTFGYSVKDLAIECFYKNSLYAQNSGMLWSIIGNIFKGDLDFNENTLVFGKFPFGYIIPNRNQIKETVGLGVDTNTYYTGNAFDCDCLCDDGFSYRKNSSSYNIESDALLLPSFMPFRSSSTSPQKLKWSAGCLGYSFASGYNNVRTFVGIDGLGNNTKGFLRDDLFRFVSIFATRIGGALYSASSFISMNMGTPQNYMEFGVLLGWDSSNPSII